MNRRRRLAAIFLTVSMVAILGVIVYVERLNATQTITVLVLRSDVTAGTPYGDETVQAVPIRADEGDFAHEHRPPAELHARYAANLHAGDILRSDDLVPFDEQVEIALTVTGSPPVAAGDSIDLYATVNGDTVLLGQRLRATAPGPPLTVLVPARDEAAWVAVASSATPFHAVRSVGGSPPGGSRSVSAEQALRLLCGPSCAQPGGPVP